MTKVCTKCGVEKVFGEFRLGHNGCKLCAQEYQKEYYKENIDKLKKREKEYRKENSDKLKEYRKEYRKENIDKLKKREKEYRKENSDKLKEYQQKHRKENLIQVLEQIYNLNTCSEELKPIIELLILQRKIKNKLKESTT